ncbi:MAG: CRTAC1 family protein [Acidobacteriota bacterium]|nr:CRTAC1 family protein [Acidobacteriota bacterium]
MAGSWRSWPLALLLPVLAGGCADSAPPPTEHGELLVDVTDEIGLDFRHFNGMTGERYLAETLGPGAALADLDGDGDLDLFLRQGRLFEDGTTLSDTIDPRAPTSPPADRYYRSDAVPGQPGLRLVAAPGPGTEDYGMGLAAGDFDGDGAIDLYLTSFGENRLLRNRGDATFEDVTAAAGVGDDRLGQAAVFFDYDRDGWLDLYLGNYVDFSLATHKPCYARSSAVDYCGPLSYSPQPDRLFRNLGNGSFQDVSAASGIARAYGAGLGAVARDLDGDGWLDLYVSNDASDNLLWLNRRDGTFLENGLLAGCAVNAAGAPEGSMGIAAADFDSDLDVDLFVTHLTEETNTLYANDGGGYFTDVTSSAGLAVPSRGYTGFGTAPIDLDNSGLLDIVAVNGEVRAIPEQDAAGDVMPLKQHNQVFRNLGGGAFAEVSREYPAVSEPLEASRALAVGDLDGDGATDLVITNNSGPAQALWNRGAVGAHWLGIALPDRAGRPSGAGSRIEVTSGGATRLRYASGDGSYLSASDPRVVVGLGAAGTADLIEVHWAVGGRLRIARPPVDRYLVLDPREGPP